MNEKPSFLWALAVGALFPILQIGLFLARFNRLNPDAPATDYIYFFISGALIGAVLIYFLRRSTTPGTYRATLIGFVIGVPFVLFGMLMGGLVGALGVILLSMAPGIFMIAIGYFLGRALSKA